MSNDFKRRTAVALGDDALRTTITRSTGILRQAQAAAVTKNTAGFAARQDHAHMLRRRALAHLPALLTRLDEQARANGIQVFWAEDAAAATRYITTLAEARRVRQVARSQAAILNEIGLDAHLNEAGVAVIPTNLGDYILTLAHDTPSHTVYPAFHRRKEEVAQLFEQKLDVPQTLDIQTLTGMARFKLRRPILEATLSVSGVALAVAENSLLAITDDSGEQRLAAAVAPIHVVVMGIEQVTAEQDDLLTLLPLLAAARQGRDLSSYTMLLNGLMSDAEAADGPSELHLVLLDNGRSDLLRWGYSEALLCIQCGACQNVCPVYREIGGHAYSPQRSGPIGAVLLPLLPEPPDATAARGLRLPARAPHPIERSRAGAPPSSVHLELAFASTLCGACAEVCPVGIDLPRLLVELRTHHAQTATPSPALRGARRLLRWAMTDPARLRTLHRWLRRSALPRHWPQPAEQSFHERWQARHRP